LEPQAGRPPASFKWIVVGCGGLLILGMLGAGGVTLALYYGHRKHSEIAKVGTQYLETEPRIVQALGSITKVSDRFGNRYTFNNGQGDAHLNFMVTGTSTNAEAEVWLHHGVSEPWRVIGAVVRPGPLHGRGIPNLIRLGTPGSDSTLLRD
jgi:hypothetical protein